MWHILKAEFIYNKYFLMTAIGSTFIISIIMENDAEASQWLAWMPFYFVAAYFSGFVQKEKRDRLYMLLPLSVKQVARVRIGMLYILYAAFALFWLPGFLSAYNLLAEQKPWTIFAASIFILAAYAAALVFTDITNTGIKKHRSKFIITLVGYAALVVLLFTLVVIYKGEENAPKLASIVLDYPVIPLVSLLPLPVLFHSGVEIFARRQTYLGGKTKKC